MADYDLTPRIAPNLDRHLVFPLLEFLQERGLYPNEHILKFKIELLNNTNMVDYAMDIHKSLYQTEDVPQDMVERRVEVVARLKALEEAAAPLVTFLQNANAVQELRADKQYNLLMLNERYQIGPDQIEALYQYAKFQFECGNYSGAADYLYQYRALCTNSERSLSALWGKLAAEILMQNWDIALEEVNRLKEIIDSKNFSSPLNQVQNRIWLMHWSLFIFFNNDNGRTQIIDLFNQDKYLNAIQTNAPHLLRYLATAFIVNKRRRPQFKEFIKVIQQEHQSVDDPITQFLACIYVNYDFDGAQKKMKECEEVILNDPFLGKRIEESNFSTVPLRDEFLENARLFIFETYCRIHPEDEARYFFQQLISAVRYCHHMEICHGDLKLTNSLLDGSYAPRLKICDFGFSKTYLLHSKPKSIAGTLRYISPEILSGTEYDGKSADVWSCGVTLYVMLFGAYPFEDEKEPENFEKTTQHILGAQYKIPANIPISEECKHILSRIFTSPASRRITIQEIHNHPWFLINLARELTVKNQAIYYSRDDPVFLQSVESIMEIVEQARKPAVQSPPVSSSIERFGWAEKENNEDQKGNVKLKVEEEDEYEVAEEKEYDEKVKEVYRSKSLSVSGVVRLAERSLVPNKFHSDHTDPSPLAATTVDQSIYGLRMPERSIVTNQIHSSHSESAVSQSETYAEKGKNSIQGDSTMYVRSAEKSIESNVSHFYQSHPSASQSTRFAGNPRNSNIKNSSISSVRPSEKSIKSNVSHPTEASEYLMQSLDFASQLSDNPSISDVRSAEKSVVLEQLHSYQNLSTSKLHAPGHAEDPIDSKVLSSVDSAQIGNLDLSIYNVHSAEKPLPSCFHFDWRGWMGKGRAK